MPAQTSTHLYLVSNQATPNITPALDTAIRPDQVILMVSLEMYDSAALLSSVLTEAAGVQVQLWTIEDAWDIEHISTRTMELLEQHPEQAFTLNATGGTKPMSMATYQVFQAYDLPVFYVHPEDDRLIWLYPRGLASHQLADRVKLPHFLLAHGSKVTSQGNVRVSPEHYDFAEYLIANMAYFTKAITTLNWYAANSKDNYSPELKLSHQGWDALQDLIERLQNINILSYNAERLWFSSEANKRFANGGWLEQYVYAQLLKIRDQIPEIQDIAQSINVARQAHNQTINNELDVTCLCNNHLYVIECKTRHSSHVGAETIYKLDSLKEMLAGIYGSGMVVSYKPMSAHDKHRAADLGIEVVDGENLQNLRSSIMQWLSKTIIDEFS